jgi:hypothetical protein
MAKVWRKQNAAVTNCKSVARMRVKYLPREKQREIAIECKCFAKEQRNPEVCIALNVERYV